MLHHASKKDNILQKLKGWATSYFKQTHKVCKGWGFNFYSSLATVRLTL